MSIGDDSAFPMAGVQGEWNPDYGMTYRQWLIGQAPPCPYPPPPAHPTSTDWVFNEGQWAIAWADEILRRLEAEQS